MSLKWYAVHTYSGYEEKVKKSVEEKAKLNGLDDRITRVIIPTERIIELKGKKKIEAEKKFYPGYILIEMELDEETWFLVKNTPRVTGFIGGIKPVPLREDEIDIILCQLDKAPAPTVKHRFEKGDNVRIIEGPFNNFVGYVEDVDQDHSRLRVMVSIFGRLTPVELSFYQAEKA